MDEYQIIFNPALPGKELAKEALWYTIMIHLVARYMAEDARRRRQ